MAQQYIYTPEEVDHEQLLPGSVRQRKNGFSVPIFYKQDFLQFQTPWVVAPFGVNRYKLGYQENENYSLSIGISTTVPELERMLQEVDAFVTRVKEYYGWECEQQSIFTYTMKDGVRVREFPPTLRLKIHKVNNTTFDAQFFDGDLREINPAIDHIAGTYEHDNQITQGRIGKGTKLRVIAQLMPIWVTKKFDGEKEKEICGVSCKLIQVQLHPRPTKTFSFK